MSAAADLGCSPADLIDLDPDLFDTLIKFLEFRAKERNKKR